MGNQMAPGATFEIMASFTSCDSSLVVVFCIYTTYHLQPPVLSVDVH